MGSFLYVVCDENQVDRFSKTYNGDLIRVGTTKFWGYSSEDQENFRYAKRLRASLHLYRIFDSTRV